MEREIALLDRLEREGVTVVERPMKGWGRYYRDRRLIVVRAGLTAGQRLAALTHEALHHWRGDDGHQDSAVEATVNRQVAMRLISAPEYALAETLAGPSTAAIAYELGLPVWVVECYREILDTRAA